MTTSNSVPEISSTKALGLLCSWTGNHWPGVKIDAVWRILSMKLQGISGYQLPSHQDEHLFYVLSFFC